MKINHKDFDDLAAKLEDSRQISSDVLMTDDFIRANSNFNNWQDFMNAGGIKNDDDFEKPEFLEFIRQHTTFETFNEMNDAAVQKYLEKRIAE